MITTETENLKTLLSKLEQLQLNGYIFRGQANSTWPLIPNAFRKDSFKNNPLFQECKTPITPIEFRRWFDNINYILIAAYQAGMQNYLFCPASLSAFFNFYVIFFNTIMHSTVICSHKDFKKTILKK